MTICSNAWNLRRLMMVVAALALVGCANPPRVDTPDVAKRPIYLLVSPAAEIASARDWPDFVQEWRAAVQQAAREHGYRLAGVNQEPAPNATPGVLVKVHIADYRYVSAGARILFGIMTGNAYVQGGATITTVPERTPVSASSINVSSTAWGGVSSAMTGRQLSNIADGILSQIKAYDTRVTRAAGAPPGSVVHPLPIAGIEQPGREVRGLPDPDRSGPDRFAAQEFAKKIGCHPQPIAALALRAPGVETYSVVCASGSPIRVQCQYGNCRAMQ